MTNTTETTNPRAPIAAHVADAAANYAATVAAGPDTVNAVLTHAGNYIIPAATDGMATCTDEVHVGGRRIPVTKFPTKPAAIDGTVARDMRRCRACRDARKTARGTATTAVAPAAAVRPAHVPSCGNPPVDRRPNMATVAESAAATMVAMPDSIFVGTAA